AEGRWLDYPYGPYPATTATEGTTHSQYAVSAWLVSKRLRKKTGGSRSGPRVSLYRAAAVGEVLGHLFVGVQPHLGKPGLRARFFGQGQKMCPRCHSPAWRAGRPSSSAADSEAEDEDDEAYPHHPRSPPMPGPDVLSRRISGHAAGDRPTVGTC